MYIVAEDHLRLGFVSRALALSEGLPVICSLLGCYQVETTAPLVHPTCDYVWDSTETTADSTVKNIL